MMTGRIVSLFLLAATVAFCQDWNPRGAADYLDSRQKQWFAWPRALASGVPCVSCHTGAPYLLARPALRRALGESQPTVYEKGLRDSLRSRLDKATPAELFPKFKEPVAAQWASTEMVFAALFLGTDSPQAFSRLWSQQITSGAAAGAWPWNSFDLDPWETPESQYYGAAMAAFATGTARLGSRDRQADALAGYLQRSFDQQPAHNKLAALLASTAMPGVLAAPAKRSLIDEVLRRQEADGGWTVASLGPLKNRPDSAAGKGSNAYATAFTAWVLERAGVGVDDPRIARALAWLRSHQDPATGSWPSASLNKTHESGSMPALFMTDAATAYASLALLEPSNPGTR